MKKKFLRRGLIFVVIIIMSLPFIGKAAVFGQGESVYVAPDEIIEDNYFGAGTTVNINGIINGDVIVAGSNVTVNAEVLGDVIAAGGMVRIDGRVAGNVRAVGADVTVNAEVGKNVMIFGNNLALSSDSSVGWSFTAFGSKVLMNGRVGGHAEMGGKIVQLGGRVAGHVKTWSDKGGKIILLPSAEIIEFLEYRAFSENVLEINDGAVLDKGRIIYEKIEIISTPKYYQTSYWAGRLVMLVGFVVLALFFQMLFKEKGYRAVELANKKFWKHMAWGLLAFVSAPLAIIFCFITIIGIPLAIALALAYGLLLLLGKVAASIYLGALMLRIKRDHDYQAKLYLVALIGAASLCVLTSIPFIGFFINLLSLWLGLGVLAAVLTRYFRHKKIL